jgi:hypothetical protein
MLAIGGIASHKMEVKLNPRILMPHIELSDPIANLSQYYPTDEEMAMMKTGASGIVKVLESLEEGECLVIGDVRDSSVLISQFREAGLKVGETGAAYRCIVKPSLMPSKAFGYVNLSVFRGSAH